jgi:two-component system cell cycle sensor histidine kinase PleC
MDVMFRQKLLATLRWSAIAIAGAMLADYVITIQLIGDRAAYTPGITFIIAVLITVPTTYALMSGRYDLRKARDELAAARDAAVHADRTKTKFFANMSHELRTPLNAILGFSELLALDVFAPRRKEYADLIHGAGEHLLSLVNDLLDLSRIEAGKLELHLVSLDIAALIEECSETVGARARSRELRLVRTIDPDLPHAVADQRAIKQILLNLLTNAIKFSMPGGAIEIFGRLTAAGELELGVRDEGIGIAQDEQSHVFERYGQTRQHNSAEKGTGLGLPIVKGLAEAHGGRVVLESRLKQGTCVTITLPPERIEKRAQIALAS